ncbi:LysR family transcriptional regulator [Ectopseudomonas alcaliphila]|uniref:LysR family transcriptional regulator n=1 Tax=Ectopseudomonas alcaliphila TaxID=101564 RepID=UPI002787C8B2|nr:MULTISPECIES: LysR family transcriptional regulator [Pseudomonas]MDP9941242.1 DNA-binding transcriptional LysR family regulator [Pseudomonas sp. 3400]MDR7013461.1 DNA-binding transcriptional LysR family regulator [Pseudomonas alcaliphila]
MNYHSWKLFIDAAELGSLSKVAIAYGTSQPHVSRQISELEQQCGGRLFQRTGRGVVLTELGERIAPKIRLWLAGTDQLTNDIRETAGTPIGTVRLGILPSTAHPLISQLYFRLRSAFPLIRLVVREGQGAQLETWLENGHLDLAILFRHGSSKRNGDICLVETETYLVGPAGNAYTREQTVTFSALHQLPLILFCRPNSWRDRLDQLSAQHGISLNVMLEADCLALQAQVVAGGGGYALLGPYALSAAKKECQLEGARLVEPSVLRQIALSVSPHGELTLACRTVMKLIQEITKAESDALGKC